VDRKWNHDARGSAHVFLSYSSRNCAEATQIAEQLERSGVRVWLDHDRISGGENYGPKIVDAVKNAKALLLCCSRESVVSQNVKQEVQLAWTYRVPCLPVLIDGVKDFAHLEYWLAGLQFVDLTFCPREAGIAEILTGLRAISEPAASAAGAYAKVPTDHGLGALRMLARFTDRIWPEPFDSADSQPSRGLVGGNLVMRDLGKIVYQFRRGDRIVLSLDLEHDGYLILIDEGTSGVTYCLCPSGFHPDKTVRAGIARVPGKGAALPYLTVSGPPGQERLLAIITRQPPPFGFMQSHAQAVPRLDTRQCDEVAAWLRCLPADSWHAIATEFEIIA
jgi:hypothetical protein